MIIVMKKNATEAQIEHVIGWIESVGYTAHPSRGVERTIIGAIGDGRGQAQLKSVEHLSGVEKVVPILSRTSSPAARPGKATASSASAISP